MQTPVQWLKEKLIESGVNLLSEEVEFIEQAKEMEAKQRQQLVDDAITNYEKGWADKKASSQTEISDSTITDQIETKTDNI